MRSGLVSDVDQLLAEQAQTWPALARGLEGLRASETRVERVYGRDVLVRHIPHRIKSTTAAVDAASISRRPCFLCPANLDPQEKGIALDSEFTAYCNPFPILERHLTIVHVEHRPQQIAGYAQALLRIAEALPGSFVIYNGPECGASAPDHLHFQTCSRALFPIGDDLRALVPHPAFGRPFPLGESYLPRTFVLRGRGATALAAQVELLLEALRIVTRKQTEAMVNIAAFVESGVLQVLVFPRAKHRPRVFESGQLTVSPATIDLCGVFVAPVKEHFERIRGADIEQILDEVTLSADAFEETLARMEVRS